MTPATVVVSLYLIVLIGLGWWGRRQRTVGSLRDFYLAGSNLGFVVLLSTLYASQYSGNTFLGYTGQAYSTGFSWIFSVGMMMVVVLVYLLFAPRLHVLAHRHGFVTPADWARFRFDDRRVAQLISIVMAISLLNYLYAQFLAMGHMTVGMSGGRVPFWAGVVGLALIIGIYETLGGLRSVAWTDVVQGVLLFGGLLMVLVLVWPRAQSLTLITEQLMVSQPALVEVPPWQLCGRWASSLVLLGLGASMYPHAIQRIYAARDAATLRRSLRVMVCMPFVTTLVVFLIGILAHGLIPPQHGLAIDRVMPEVLAELSGRGALSEWGAVVVLTAALAAMMSTADSALLSLSAVLARDVLGQWRPMDEASIARAGKWFSWTIIGVLVVLAVQPPTTLWRLIEIKMEILIQVGPIFILGIRSRHLDSQTAWRALLTGVSLAALAFFAGIDRIGGIHAGTYACAVNLAICCWGVRKNRRLSAAAAGEIGAEV
jgi:SSS family solute:Na+ symporter